MKSLVFSHFVFMKNVVALILCPTGLNWRRPILFFLCMSACLNYLEFVLFILLFDALSLWHHRLVAFKSFQTSLAVSAGYLYGLQCLQNSVNLVYPGKLQLKLWCSVFMTSSLSSFHSSQQVYDALSLWHHRWVPFTVLNRSGFLSGYMMLCP